MKFNFDYPKKVIVGDISIRDGLQHEEKFISTDAKLYYAEQLILAGVKRLELTNLGNPRNLPQFRDAEELLRRLRESKTLAKAGVKPTCINPGSTPVSLATASSTALTCSAFFRRSTSASAQSTSQRRN